MRYQMHFFELAGDLQAKHIICQHFVLRTGLCFSHAELIDTVNFMEK